MLCFPWLCFPWLGLITSGQLSLGEQFPGRTLPDGAVTNSMLSMPRAVLGTVDVGRDEQVASPNCPPVALPFTVACRSNGRFFESSTPCCQPACPSVSLPACYLTCLLPACLPFCLPACLSACRLGAAQHLKPEASSQPFAFRAERSRRWTRPVRVPLRLSSHLLGRTAYIPVSPQHKRNPPRCGRLPVQPPQPPTTLNNHRPRRIPPVSTEADGVAEDGCGELLSRGGTRQRRGVASPC